jgi:hypothetical protein
MPITTVPPLSVCPVCGRTVVLVNGAARLAQAADTIHLTDDQKIALKKLRPVNA